MDEVLAIFSKRLETRSIQLQLQIADGVEFVGSSGEIRQFLCNLVANALDASSHGGHITVRAQKRQSDGTNIRVMISVAADPMIRFVIVSVNLPEVIERHRQAK